MTSPEVEDIKRYFGVVAENLDSKIQAVGDGVAANGEKIDRLDGRVGRLEDGQGRVELRLDAVEARLGRVEGEMRKGFSELGQRVERLETKQPL